MPSSVYNQLFEKRKELCKKKSFVKLKINNNLGMQIKTLFYFLK
jgi:hypothetical protein